MHDWKINFKMFLIAVVKGIFYFTRTLNPATSCTIACKQLADKYY